MFPIADDVPRQSRPYWTWGLILINALVFILEVRLPEDDLVRLFDVCGIVPARFEHPNYWPFLTSMFLHGGVIHLITNMWTLWIFGDNVEDRMGPLRYILFYGVCGVTAGIVHLYTNPGSPVPAIGASGAIAGVLGAYMVLFPKARVITVVPVFFYPLFLELPALFYLGIWFLAQFLSGAVALATPEAGAGIAWWAHIGGFAAGVLSFWLFLKPERRKQRRREWRS